MSSSPKSAAKRLKKVLAKHFGGRIKDVVLFGSQASGKAHEDSDYDMLVVLDRDCDWDFWNQVMEFVYELELKLDILFHVFLISEEELRNSPRGAQSAFGNAVMEGTWV